MKNLTSPPPLPFFFIGRDTTEKRKNNFITRKHGLLCNELGKSDTTSIWYSRDHIAKILQEIDHAGGDGLRIYFGAYESGHEFDGQLCLVMNTTREKTVNGKAMRVTVVLENEPDFNERSELLRTFDPLKPPVKRDFNFGSPCPPRCPEEEEPVPASMNTIV